MISKKRGKANFGTAMHIEKTNKRSVKKSNSHNSKKKKKSFGGKKIILYHNNNCCELCGKRHKMFDSFLLNPNIEENRYNVFNMVVLCRECSQKAEKHREAYLEKFQMIIANRPYENY